MLLFLYKIVRCDYLLQVYDFTADDLSDQGEIGHGNYGTVNKMYHEASGTVMAVKVRRYTPIIHYRVYCKTNLFVKFI